MSEEKPAPPILTFTYRNHRGEVSLRKVTGPRLWYGKTKYHTEMQWFLQAYDNRKQAARDFAFSNIVSGMEILPPRNAEISAPENFIAGSQEGRTQELDQSVTQGLGAGARARLDALNVMANEETPNGERAFLQADIQILLRVVDSLLEMNTVAVERAASLETRIENTQIETAKFNKTINDLERHALSSEGASTTALLQNMSEEEFSDLWRQVQAIRKANASSEG